MSAISASAGGGGRRLVHTRNCAADGWIRPLTVTAPDMRDASSLIPAARRADRLSTQEFRVLRPMMRIF